MVLQEAWAYNNIVSHFHERLNRQWHNFRLNVSENVPLVWISFLFQQLPDFNICVPVPPMLIVNMVDYTISSPTFFGNYIKKYLNVTLFLKLHLLPRLRP